MSDKYAGKHPILVKNRNLGYMKNQTIELGLNQSATIGISSIIPQSAIPQVKVVKVIGGNIFGTSGLESVKYAATLPPITELYDANVDVVFPAGMGIGKLYIDGMPSDGNVFIRHDFTGQQMAIPAGQMVQVMGTETITVSGGVNDGETMSAFKVYWL